MLRLKKQALSQYNSLQVISMIAKTVKKEVCLIKQGKHYYTAWLIETNNVSDSTDIESGSPGEKICQKLSKIKKLDYKYSHG